MQNFTLGKKGISMLLFGLALLTTSFSSFGQENCPTVVDSAQDFCYLATVSDLEATADGDTVRWYRTATSTNPIPNDELLANGIYFAGNQSGTCTTRAEVSVAVNTPVAPTKITPGATFDPCQFSTGETNTVSEIIAQFTPSTDYEIEVFATEFGTTVLGSDDTLTPEASYYVGQRNPTASPSCPSLRVAIRYTPILALAPTGEATPTFCEGATVANLEATGNNRWYSTATSQPALADSTPLINGETYYASQIVNRSNSSNPPCESVERLAVTVTVNNVIVEETQRFCASIGEGNNFRTPEVQDLSPDATWYADDTFTTPLAFDEPLIDGNDYFTRIPENCETLVVTAEFFDTPNAGMTTQVSFCSNAPEVNLVNFIRRSTNLPDEPVHQNGFFTPSLEDNMFNPSDYAPGSPITFIYTVPGNDDCPTDTSRITVTVQAAPNAGQNQTLEFCQSEIESLFELYLQNPEAAEAMLIEKIGDVDTSGSFSEDSLQQIAQLYAIAAQTGIFPFEAETTYTVENEQNCSSSSIITLLVNGNPYAGDNTSIEVSREDDAIDLYTVLSNNSSQTPDTTNGTWAPGNADGSFDPATGEPGIYTYTVTNANGCSDSANVTVTITEECPVVVETTQSFCQSIGEGNNFRKPTVSDLLPANTTWFATVDSETALPANTILENETSYFAGNEDGTCPDRGSVLVTLLDSPNAGATTTITVCSADEPFDIVTRMNNSLLGPADAGGTVIPALASGTTMFNPAVDNAQRYTYRVLSTTSCPDDDASITINILVNEDANAGADFSLEFCTSDEDVNLFDRLADGVTMSGTFVGLTNGIFSPSTSGVDTFEVIYNIAESLPCVNGADFATITITVRGVSEAPVADAVQSFCLVNNSTVANLVASGENVVWYEDEDLTKVAPATTPLENAAVYYAVATGDDSCGSPSTMVTVSITDPNAPTLKLDGNEFCRGDNPTIQDLLNNLNGTGIRIYASPTGGTALTITTALQNGVNYFATSTAENCESSERLAIPVEVAFCGIPEGFSPNGDNINDRFVIPDIRENYPNFTIEIFNRWGNKVFRGNTSTPDWDGISNQSGTLGDNVLPVGVYFYILNYNDGATTPEQGKLYLSR